MKYLRIISRTDMLSTKNRVQALFFLMAFVSLGGFICSFFYWMNYKKIGLLLVAASAVVLAGCSHSGKNMTFQETYNSFRDNHTSEGLRMVESFGQAEALAEKTNYALSGSITGGIAINANIAANSTVINEGMNTDTAMSISGNVTQPGLDDVISFDTNGAYKLVSGQAYLNFEKLALSSQKGNPQISMIGAFTSILTNKWISLSASGMDTSATLKGLNLSNVYSLPAALVTSLKNNPIFTETGKETIDGNPVYHIALDATGLYLAAKEILNNEVVKAFVGGTGFSDAELMDWAQTFVVNSDFKGSFIVYSKKNIVLTIDQLRLDQVQTLKGTVEEDKSHFEVTDASLATGSTVATMDTESKGDTTTLMVSVPSISFNLQLAVDMKTATANAIAYAMRIIASHSTFNAALDGDVEVNKTNAVAIEAPANYQTIDDLVGGFRDLVGAGAENPSGLDAIPAGDELLQ